MGRDKALIRLAGRTLLERSVDLVRTAGGHPVIVGPERAIPSLAGVTRIDETAEGAPAAGPLPALRHGLLWTGAARVVALGCDLPLLTPAFLALLVREAERFDAVVPECGGARHVLAAAYGRSCLPVIERRLDRGERALHAILGEVRTLFLDETRIADCGGAGMFLNVNTPADLERAAALLVGGGG
jgi:molybdopterin-guanine dinucleotide biosynthesis protein A